MYETHIIVCAHEPLAISEDEYSEGIIWEAAIVMFGGNPSIPGTDAALNTAVTRGAVKVVKNAETGIDMYYVPKAAVGQR